MVVVKKEGEEGVQHDIFCVKCDRGLNAADPFCYTVEMVSNLGCLILLTFLPLTLLNSLQF